MLVKKGRLWDLVRTTWHRSFAALTSLWVRLRRMTLRQWLLIGAAVVGSLAILHTCLFLLPRSARFSYSAPTCMLQPTLLPRLHTSPTNDKYQLSYTARISIGRYPLYADKLCIEATQAPTPNTTYSLALRPFGLPFPRKSVRVSADSYPALRTSLATEQISPKDPLALHLASPDTIFDYAIVGDNKKAPCTKQHTELSCDIPSMKLTQGATYHLRLERSFRGQPTDSLFAKPITTTTPVEVTQASIAAGGTVYDKPTSLSLTLNKPVRSVSGISLLRVNSDGSTQPLDIATQLENDRLVITFGAPLPRGADFRLSVQEVVGTDNGFLPTPYTLAFKTSTGPKVTNANVGTYGVSTEPRITLTFDSPVSDKQIASAIYIEAAGNRVAATISVSGNRVTLSPTAALPRCTGFVIKVTNTLENTYGIAGNSAWQYNSRTICQTTQVIGTSVQGRSIIAYRFGSGASKIIYFGGLHGNEQSSKYTLDSWIDELERNYHRIPAHRTIIVIPNTNPDGIAAGRRLNARNVDLNRNFPANDWKSDVTIPGGALVTGGGGSAPLSEPESSALANYILAQSPRLVLSYHADAAIVIANDAGDSRSLATTYGQKSRLTATGNSESGGVFNYDTTGALENWLYDQPGIPNLLVELSTSRSNEFTRHQSAMWTIADLP